MSDSKADSTLYVGWAIENLARIDHAIRQLSKVSQIHMNEVVNAIERARDKLVKTAPEYARAAEILRKVEAARRGKFDYSDIKLPPQRKR